MRIREFTNMRSAERFARGIAEYWAAIERWFGGHEYGAFPVLHPLCTRFERRPVIEPQRRRGGRPKPGRRLPSKERTEEIVAQRAAGMTLSAIAKCHRISPERVRQIVARAMRHRRLP